MNRVVENSTTTRNRRVTQRSRIAARALDQYCLAGATLTLLDVAENTTFRVDIPVQPHLDRHPYLGRIAGRRFVLRVLSVGEQAAAARSELVWLAALLRDTSLTVPEPVPTRYGSLVAAVTSQDEDEVAHCVLLRWVEGQPPDHEGEPTTLRMVGRYMAELHAHSESFQPPTGFVRPHWDLDRMCGARSAYSALDMPSESHFFSREEQHLFEATRRCVARVMSSIGEGPDVFGLIHSGLKQGNYLLYGDEVRSVDFAGCGWGYYLFDIATTLGEWRHNPNYAAMRHAFLDGYRLVRPFSQEHEALIDTFISARYPDIANGALG